ncbi:MAG: hypothetical protein H6553_08240 [Chitinophagales bacterium]|nr:hypothetical protein [Chitinophagales bacterium]
MRYFLILFLMLLFGLNACKKCKTCTHYHGAFVEDIVVEKREVCDENEQQALVNDSATSYSYWICE